MFLLALQDEVGEEYYHEGCHEASLGYHIKKLTIIHFLLLNCY